MAQSSKGKSKAKVIIVEPNPQKANRIREDLKELIVDIDVEIVNNKDQINEAAGFVIGSDDDYKSMLYSLMKNQSSQLENANDKVDQQIENINSKIDSIKEAVDQIHEWLTGNGSPEKTDLSEPKRSARTPMPPRITQFGQPSFPQ
jgi:RNA processing factor Prp31